MANSIQVINKESEIFNDLDLLVLIHLMIEEVLKQEHRFSLLKSLTGFWTECCVQYAPGVIELELDKIVLNPSMKEEFLELLAVIETNLKEYGSILPADIFRNRWKVSDVNIFDYKITLLLSAIEGLRKLVEG